MKDTKAREGGHVFFTACSSMNLDMKERTVSLPLKVWGCVCSRRGFTYMPLSRKPTSHYLPSAVQRDTCKYAYT